jgi:FK506-binding protein 4/5
LECVLSSRPDLWRVLMLHPGAMAEIPELEFEIGADHKRRVDSIYNHIGGAIFNLERHVEMLGEDGEQASRERQGIMDVCDELRKVLDMEGGPYTLVVTDPGGLSAFKPPTGVKVTALEQTTQYDRAARALAVAEEDEDGGDESDDSDDESAELLAAALADMKTGDECDVTPKRDGGVMKKVTKVGEGTERPGKGAEVAVHYVGTLTDGTKFDSSVDRGKPIEFTLGIGQVIKGWDLGIGSMRKGEKATLTIAPEYGYGDAGAGGVIPGGATLLFDVELVEWK